MSSLTKKEISAVLCELRDIGNAILDGKSVWMQDQTDGWVLTQRLDASKPRSCYHIGDQPPA